MKIQVPYGRKYEAGARYGYGAVDYTVGNSTGRGTLLSGETQKLCRELADKFNVEVAHGLQQMVTAVIAKESGNSEELLLFAINDGGLYESKRKSIDAWIRNYFDDEEKEGNAGLHSLVQSIVYFFEDAALKYKKEVETEEWVEFTQLDFAVCALQYWERCKAEYSANKMR